MPSWSWPSPDQDILSLLSRPEEFTRLTSTEARSLQVESIINALDLMYFWLYQPCAQQTLTSILRTMTREERVIVARSQGILSRVPGGQPAFRGRPARAQFRPRPVLLPGQLRKLYPYTQQTLRRILQRPSSAAQAQAAYIGLPLKKQGDWGKGTFLKKCPFPQTLPALLPPLSSGNDFCTCRISGIFWSDTAERTAPESKGPTRMGKLLEGSVLTGSPESPASLRNFNRREGILRSPYEDCRREPRLSFPRC